MQFSRSWPWRICTDRITTEALTVEYKGKLVLWRQVQRAYERSSAADRAAARTHTSVRYGLTGGRVWLLCAILFFIVMGTSTVGFWQPTIIRSSGVKDPLMIGLLTTIPYLAALFGMLYAGRSSDRLRERRWHAIVPVLLSIPGFLLCALGGHEPVLAMIGLTIATASIITSLPMFWGIAVLLPRRCGCGGGHRIDQLDGQSRKLRRTGLAGLATEHYAFAGRGADSRVGQFADRCPDDSDLGAGEDGEPVIFGFENVCPEPRSALA